MPRNVYLILNIHKFVYFCSHHVGKCSYLIYLYIIIFRGELETTTPTQKSGDRDTQPPWIDAPVLYWCTCSTVNAETMGGSFIGETRWNCDALDLLLKLGLAKILFMDANSCIQSSKRRKRSNIQINRLSDHPDWCRLAFHPRANIQQTNRTSLLHGQWVGRPPCSLG